MESIVDSVKYWNCLSKNSVCILMIVGLLFKEESTARSVNQLPNTKSQTRQRINCNEGPGFMRYASQPDNFISYRAFEKKSTGNNKNHSDITGLEKAVWWK